MNFQLTNKQSKIKFLKESPFFLIIATLIAILSSLSGTRSILVILLLLSGIVFIPNRYKSLLFFVSFLPSIGEPETNKFLSSFWKFPTLLLALSYVYAFFTVPKRIHFDISITTLFFLYISVCMISLLVGFDLNLLGPNSTEGPLGSYTRIIDLLLIHFVVIFVMSSIESDNELRKVFWIIVISGLFYALSIFITGAEPESGGRQFGIFPDAHPAAIHMLICSIFSLSLLKGSSKYQRYFLISCFFIFSITHFLTYSKTLFMAFPFVIMIWSYLEGGTKRFYQTLISFICTVILIFLVKPVFVIKLFEVAIGALFFDPNLVPPHYLSTYHVRVLYSDISWNLFFNNPLLGIGFSKQFWVTPPYPSLLHNYYFIVLIETGAFGFFLFISTISCSLLFLFKSRFHYHIRNKPEMVSIMNGLIVGTISILIFFFTQPGVSEGLRHLWVFIGISACMNRLCYQQSST